MSASGPARTPEPARGMGGRRTPRGCCAAPGRQRKRPALAGRPLIDGLPALRSAAAPSAAAAALLRLIDPQGASAEVLAIQVLNGPGSVGSRHLHEAEAPR